MFKTPFNSILLMPVSMLALSTAAVCSTNDATISHDFIAGSILIDGHPAKNTLISIQAPDTQDILASGITDSYGNFFFDVIGFEEVLLEVGVNELDMYEEKIATNQTIKLDLTSKEPERTSEKALRYEPIHVLDATYGANCGAPRGNKTWDARRCDGNGACNYTVSAARLGDPAPGCHKDYEVRYRCGTVTSKFAFAAAEASGRTPYLSCYVDDTPGERIQVIKAEYGRNCNAPVDNATSDVGGYCNGFRNCRYRISHNFLGDPAYGCSKDFRVDYSCGGQVKSTYHYPEASGGWVELNCQ